MLRRVMRRLSHGMRNIRANAAQDMGLSSRVAKNSVIRRLLCAEAGIARQNDGLRAAFHFELRENARFIGCLAVRHRDCRDECQHADE